MFSGSVGGGSTPVLIPEVLSFHLNSHGPRLFDLLWNQSQRKVQRTSRLSLKSFLSEISCMNSTFFTGTLFTLCVAQSAG